MIADLLFIFGVTTVVMSVLLGLAVLFIWNDYGP